MEQAVVDADKLKEAAIRNAENSILEKYSKDIKGALKTILEQAPPMPGMEDEMLMPPEAGMMPPGPMPGMMPPGPDMAAEAGIPLAATAGEKLCPCPDDEAKMPITINLDDLIGVADMIKDEDAPAASEMFEEPPMDPMMMDQPPMGPDPMSGRRPLGAPPMMEGEMIDLGGLLAEQGPHPWVPHAPGLPTGYTPPPPAVPGASIGPLRPGAIPSPAAAPAVARGGLGGLASGARAVGRFAGNHPLLVGSTAAELVGPYLPFGIGDKYSLGRHNIPGFSDEEGAYEMWKQQESEAGRETPSWAQYSAYVDAGMPSTWDASAFDDELPEKPDPADYKGERGLYGYAVPEIGADVIEIGAKEHGADVATGAGVGYGLQRGAEWAIGTGAKIPGAPPPSAILKGIQRLGGWRAAGLGAAALGLKSIWDDQDADQSAWKEDSRQYEKDKKEYFQKDLDLTGNPVPAPGPKTAGPEYNPETGNYGPPSGTTAPGGSFAAPGLGTGEGQIPIDDYYPEGRHGPYVSALGFQPGTSSWLREANSVSMEIARQKLVGQGTPGSPDYVAGDWSALGTIRRLHAELGTIPQYTRVDALIARKARKGARDEQRIMTRKARPQARSELAKQRQELRRMSTKEFAGVGGGESNFPRYPQPPLQEGNDNMIDINEEELASIIEELIVDVDPQSVRVGYPDVPESEKDYAEELALARRSSTEEKEKQEAIQATVEDLSEKNDRLTKYSEELSAVAKQLKEKLEDVSLQNSKLFYINRTLSDASLNGRQKDKIAESIQSAVSVEEAKVIYETLQSAVPNSPSEKRGKKTLSEAISRPSAILPRRKSGASDREMVFRDRMKILAGINKD